MSGFHQNKNPKTRKDRGRRFLEYTRSRKFGTIRFSESAKIIQSGSCTTLARDLSDNRKGVFL